MSLDLTGKLFLLIEGQEIDWALSQLRIWALLQDMSSFICFTRSLDALAQRAQRNLENETLQKVVQDGVDPQKNAAARNELGIST